MHRPVLSDNRHFALGWEMGLLYGRMRAGEPEIAITIHAENDEQVRVMAARLGYVCDIEPLPFSAWLSVWLVRGT